MPSMPATTKAGGQSLAFPDVCQTPAAPSPVPVPYPNVAQFASADGAIAKVLIENKETVVESSEIPNTSGDQAGSIGGVISGVVGGPYRPQRVSSKIYAAGKKIVFHTASGGHNGTNANQPLGTQIAPSQTKVFVAM